MRGDNWLEYPPTYAGSLGGVNMAGIRSDCNEIVMIARSERIMTKQNGSNRLIWKPLKRVVK